MTNPSIIIRPETPSDQAGVSSLIRDSFTDIWPAAALGLLRRFGPPPGAEGPVPRLVAERDGSLLGYALCFEVALRHAGKPVRSACLAPVAVPPEHRGRGVGQRLVRHALQYCACLDYGLVLAYGPEASLRRYGFVRARGGEPGLGDVLMMLRLDGKAAEEVGDVDFPWLRQEARAETAAAEGSDSRP